MMKVQDKRGAGSQGLQRSRPEYLMPERKGQVTWIAWMYTHMQNKKRQQQKREHGDGALPSQVEVIKSRKPIKKMINIHMGDAASGCRWDGFTILSHVYMYNGSSEQCSPARYNCGVLGGGDQEVNMIQSSSFIRPLKVMVCKETGAARWIKKHLHTTSLQALQAYQSRINHVILAT